MPKLPASPPPASPPPAARHLPEPAAPAAGLDLTARPPLIPGKGPRRQSDGGEHDAFGWLRARNWQAVLKNPARLPAPIRRIIDAENRYAARVFKPAAALRRRIQGELRGRMLEDDTTPPTPDGDWLYGERYRKGGEYPVLWRSPRKGGRARTLLDCNREARPHDFFDLGAWTVSPDHRRLAWASDTAGSEFYRIAIRDLDSGQDIESIVDAAAAALWSADGNYLFYVAVDDKARPCRVMRHRLGTAQADDALVHEEAGAGYFVDLGQSQDGTLGFIEVADHDSSETRIIDLQQPLAEPRLFRPREAGVEYEIDRHGHDLVVLTNAGGAEDFRIVACPLHETGDAGWREVVPHRPGHLISGHACFAGHLVWQELHAATPAVHVREWASGATHAVSFDDAICDISFDPGQEYETTSLRVTWSSLASPEEIYDYDMATRQRVLVKRQEIPSGHDPARYSVRRLEAVSHDGAKVPVSVLQLRDLPATGARPLFLEAYGAYGHAFTAGFDEDVFSLVDRGFVYAIAHIRGGSDCGRRWYLDGKREKKPNSFHDFIAAAEMLAGAGLTAPGRIVAYGASAGGMVMGAVANMAPALFGGIVAEVPFVDVLNTMMDGDLPLTPPEWPEWGNPITDPAARTLIAGYSPYDNVRAQDYPAILALGGLTDPRVTYWEPLKWVARLRDRMTGGGPVVLRTHTGAGHGGSSGRYERLREIALIQAFAIAVTGAPETPLVPVSSAPPAPAR